jgi:DNA repair protein RadA/Sms
VTFGEVGLAGEVRAVGALERRLGEAKKLGFARCVLPRDLCARAPAGHGLDLVGVRTVREGLAALIGR